MTRIRCSSIGWARVRVKAATLCCTTSRAASRWPPVLCWRPSPPATPTIPRHQYHWQRCRTVCYSQYRQQLWVLIPPRRTRMCCLFLFWLARAVCVTSRRLGRAARARLRRQRSLDSDGVDRRLQACSSKQTRIMHGLSLAWLPLRMRCGLTRNGSDWTFRTLLWYFPSLTLLPQLSHGC
jgi:hypothetical protein